MPGAKGLNPRPGRLTISGHAVCFQSGVIQVNISIYDYCIIDSETFSSCHLAQLAAEGRAEA